MNYHKFIFAVVTIIIVVWSVTLFLSVLSLAFNIAALISGGIIYGLGLWKNSRLGDTSTLVLSLKTTTLTRKEKDKFLRKALNSLGYHYQVLWLGLGILGVCIAAALLNFYGLFVSLLIPIMSIIFIWQGLSSIRVANRVIKYYT